MSLWLCVSIPTSVASPFHRNLALFLEGRTLENVDFSKEKQRFSRNRCFSKDGPRGPQITSKSQENWPRKLQKTPKKQTNVAFGAVQKHTEKKAGKCSKIESKEGQKPLEPDLAGERKAQFGICCENVDSCCHLWNLLFCVGLYCYLQRFAAI